MADADDLDEVPAELSEATREFLTALANPARQRILLLFVRGAELSVGEVAERAGLGQPTASAHLSRLRRGGVLAARRDGKNVFYSSDKRRIMDALDDLRAYLEGCC
jgi:DNA-binding transcriptional ArsR family regulator